MKYQQNLEQTQKKNSATRPTASFELFLFDSFHVTPYRRVEEWDARRFFDNNKHR